MSIGSMSIGSMGIGSINIGSMSIGSMSIGSMSIGSMSIGRGKEFQIIVRPNSVHEVNKNQLSHKMVPQTSLTNYNDLLDHMLLVLELIKICK